MTTQISHFIDGQRTAGQSTRSADVFDPNTGQIQAKVPMAGKSDIDAPWPPRSRPKRAGPHGIPSAVPGC